MVTELEEGGATLSNKVHESQTEAQHSCQREKENFLSNKSCFIDLRCEHLEGLGVFFLIHVSVVIGIGITDQRNWMQEPAKADVIFVASWSLRSHAYSIPFPLWSVESPQTSPEMVVLGELVQERS